MPSVVPHYMLLTLALPALLKSVDLATSKHSKKKLVDILAYWLENPNIVVQESEINIFVTEALKSHAETEDQNWALQVILDIGVANFKPAGVKVN